MSSILDTLIEMGFTKQKAELAIQKTGSNDLQAITEWLVSHEDEPVETVQQTQENTEMSNDLAAASVDSSSTINSDSNPVAKSIQCDDCGKLFKTQEEVEFHASKSGHENFSESTEEKKPLTEEEKKEQLAKIEAKLKQRRLEREAREKNEALLREKNRIKSGKELLEAKKKHEELEMKKIVEQRRREKEEERLAKQRVREQIEQDKLARKAKFGNTSISETSTMQIPNTSPPNITDKVSIQNYSEVKLQIRLPNGSSLSGTFGAKEPLSAVRLYIEMNAKETEGAFNLMTNFPRKTFGNEDYDKPLDSLGLAPTATLFVNKSNPHYA